MNANYLSAALSMGDAFYIWGALAAAIALMAVELAVLAAGYRDLAARTQTR